jgi:hypothetical protein
MTPEEILSLREKQERQLWAAVILQALDDAAGKIEYFGGTKEAAERHKRLVRRRARDWFHYGGKDFKEVCALADMDPDWIRANALEKIKASNGGVEYVPEPTKRAEPRKPVNLYGPKAKIYTHDGKSMKLKDWSEATGIDITTLRFRLKQGWPLADVFTAGRRRDLRAQFIDYMGERITVKELSTRTGISKGALQHRLNRGMTGDALTAPSIRSQRRNAGGTIKKKAARAA